ncbi:hypothetical protein PTKIN_Ptkin16aG0474700 [Pterospermum kingtungense]
MASKYAMEGSFSVKCNVYSLGVRVLEVLSGRKNTNHFHFDDPLKPVGYVS